MPSKIIAQRELRNNIASVLRDAEAGVQFTITVRGRPVATLGPAPEAITPRTDLDARAVADLLARTPVDEGFATDLARLRELELPTGEPWPNR